ncbi:hypothetical protein [Longimicrobium sp.]|uniref:hypothetical protein n=1 Tax=Longimicrobium sp. TaxID=2029185 RepID=UPI002E3139B3|nr:hypothetical protein [Longimicrobium sp.]HEX6039193.1 hypothetical protein [Longimicrobium sp.]
MLVPAFNASHGTIVTLPRAILLAVVAALVAAAVAALGPDAGDQRMVDADRPTLVRRLDALPPIVVSAPPHRVVTAEDAGR